MAAACQDECAAELSDEVKDWFKKIGSKEISSVGYRHSFTFIGRSSKTGVHEKRASKPDERVEVTQMFIMEKKIPAGDGKKPVDEISDTESDFSSGEPESEKTENLVSKGSENLENSKIILRKPGKKFKTAAEWKNMKFSDSSDEDEKKVKNYVVIDEKTEPDNLLSKDDTKKHITNWAGGWTEEEKKELLMHKKNEILRK